MHTIRQVAEACGVSRSTALRAARDLDMTSGRKGKRIELTDEQASILSDNLVKGLRKPVHEEDPGQPDVVVSDKLEKQYEARIAELKDRISEQSAEIQRLSREADQARAQLETTSAMYAAEHEERVTAELNLQRLRQASLLQRVFGFRALLPSETGRE